MIELNNILYEYDNLLRMSWRYDKHEKIYYIISTTIRFVFLSLILNRGIKNNLVSIYKLVGAFIY